jgi:hypothetical protein
MSITLPAGTKLTIGLTPPLLGGIRVWSRSGGNGTLVANNDGTSALLTVGASGTDVIDVANYVGSPWSQNKRYKVGDQILDLNRHVQEVTASAGTRLEVAKSVLAGAVTKNDLGYTAPDVEVVESALSDSIDSSTNVHRALEKIDYTNGADEGSGLPQGTTSAAAGFSGSGGSDGLPTDGSSFDAKPPAFSTGGGSVLDGDLTWTDQGAQTDSDTWDSLSILTGATGVVPAGNYLLLPLSV